MMNRVNMMGRLTKDVELRRTDSGKAVASFSIAVDDDFRKDHTIFVNCVAWGSTGEFISKYFSKGRMIGLDGRLDIRDYTDKNGNKRYVTEIIVDHGYFADSKPQGQSTNATQEDYAPIVEEDEQLPF